MTSQGERAELELAVARQAVAEWRDRQILSAAALLNREAMRARDAFEREVETATAAQTLFGPSVFANARIDALLGSALEVSLIEFLEIAAKELCSIDGRLTEIGDALRRADAILLPIAHVPTSPVAADEQTAVEIPPTESGPADRRGLLSVPARLARRASTLADGAGSAADELLQEKLGLKNRLRTAAADRIAESWMSGVGEPKSPLAQLIALIDETTHAARMRLS